jgi:hypothetical protein
MPILRTIKSDYQMYENQRLQCLVAIEQANCKTIKDWFKKYKGKKEQPKDKVPGYKFINDEEFNSLKIDFENSFVFDIRDLTPVK